MLEYLFSKPPTGDLKASGLIYIVECRHNLEKNDKDEHGHRWDTVPIQKAIQAQGWKCELCYYDDASAAQLIDKIKKADGYICRINPGPNGLMTSRQQV